MSARNRERNRQNPSLLDEVLERRVLLYVLAAGATLAGPTATQAKIIFTPSTAVVAYGVCNTNSSLQIDLNNDGVNDFTVVGDTFCYSGNGISVFKSSLNVKGSAGSDGIVGLNNNYGRFAAALRKGARIGSTANFSDKGLMQLRNFAELPKFAPKFAPSNYRLWEFFGHHQQISGGAIPDQWRDALRVNWIPQHQRRQRPTSRLGIRDRA